MAYVSLKEGPFTADLVDVSTISAESFNPRDYLDFTTAIKVSHEPLTSIADSAGEATHGEMIRKVKSREIDRFTGEVFTPTEEETDTTALSFQAGDILFHKYRARIGRIGIVSFAGLADSHIYILRPHDIDPHYLLLALRSVPVLVQLPYRETTRPGVRVPDITKLAIPRLGELEHEIGNLIRSVFDLRSRSRKVLTDLLETFDRAISSRLPTDMEFFVDNVEIGSQTFDPGHYFLKMLEWTFPRNVQLDQILNVIQPASLQRGDNCLVITLKDYEFDGIKPLRPMKAKAVSDSNFAQIDDILLNKLHSRQAKPARATMLVPPLEYLRDLGISLRTQDEKTLVPIYPEIFILRRKDERSKDQSDISLGYLCLFFNSLLFQSMFRFMMGGSTGRQRIRKSKLLGIRIPILDDRQMDAFSTAVEICLEISSETFRILLSLHETYDRVIRGRMSANALTDLVRKEKPILDNLIGEAVSRAVAAANEVSEVVYATES